MLLRSLWYSLLALWLTTSGGLAGEANAPAAPSRFTFVLVHGAWAGGWEHKKVDRALTADGHTVYRVTLTGQGERVHLASAEIDLNVHIQDVVNVIIWEELTDVVLVGHSYGGMVITGVVDRIPNRFRRVIYLDAFLPENGESLYSSMGGDRPTPPSADGFVSLGNQDRSKDPIPHIVPQSIKTFNQPVSLEHQDVARKVPTTYILTVDPGKAPETDGFFRFHERARARGWPTLIMEGSHIVHVDRTRELVDLLERVAAGETRNP